jgi:hypothetical protein
MRLAPAAVAAVLLAVGPLAAANPNTTASPLYGTATLAAGFTPDPHEVAVRAGGDVSVSTLSLPSHCAGFITTAQPDVRLNWTAGGSPLRLAVCAGSDTSLVINDARGNWHCNDDAEGTNPVLEFNGLSGQFDIWIGTYAAGGSQPATLRITERGGAICGG